MRHMAKNIIPVFLPADREASWPLLPRSVSLLWGGTVQPEKPLSGVLKVTDQVWKTPPQKKKKKKKKEKHLL